MKFKIRAKVSPGLTRAISRQQKLLQRPTRQKQRSFTRSLGPGDGIAGCCECCCDSQCTGSCEWGYNTCTRVWDFIGSTCSTGCSCPLPADEFKQDGTAFTACTPGCYCSLNEWTIVVPLTDGDCSCSLAAGEYRLTGGEGVWTADTPAVLCGDGFSIITFEMLCDGTGLTINVYVGGLLSAEYGGESAPGTATLIASNTKCGWPPSFVVACIEDEETIPACDGTQNEGCGQQGWVESGGTWVADGITNCSCGSAPVPLGIPDIGETTTTYCCPDECLCFDCGDMANAPNTLYATITGGGCTSQCPGCQDPDVSFTLSRISSTAWSGVPSDFCSFGSPTITFQCQDNGAGENEFAAIITTVISPACEGTEEVADTGAPYAPCEGDGDYTVAFPVTFNVPGCWFCELCGQFQGNYTLTVNTSP